MTLRGRLAPLCAALVLLLLATGDARLSAAAPAKAPAGSKAATTTTTKPASTGAATVRKQQIDDSLRTLKQQVAEASAEEAQVLGRLDDTIARRATLDRRLAAIDAEVAAAEAAVAVASAELDRVEADLRRSSTKLADTEAGLHAARRAVVERAIDSYVRAPHLTAASAVLGSDSYRDLAETESFLDTSVRSQRATVAQFQQLRLRLESEQVGLRASREEVTTSRAAVTEQRDRLLAGRNEQAEIRRQVASEEAAEQSLLSELRTKVKRFEAEIAALKTESDSIAAFLRARQTGKPPAPGSGVLGRPVGGPLTSGFGSRTHPILGTVRNHTGVDFGGPSGTAIKAAAAGTVVSAGDRSGYGTTVIIDHGGTLATLYAHQSRMAVTGGQTVTRGQTIGYVGSTGFSTGPHLHFEVRVNGNPVDPMRYL